MLSRSHLYVDAIARSGSIRRAAQQLRVAASAVNRQLLDLERDLGVELFERLPGGVRATAAGELLLATIRRQRMDFDLLHSQLEELRGLRRGVVRLAAIEGAARGLVPQVLIDFRAGHPRVTFEVTVGGTAELALELRADRVELALLYNLSPDPALVVLAQQRAPLHAVMATDHPLACRRSVRLHECLAYPVALSSRKLGGRALLDTVLARSSLTLEPALETESFDLMARFVVATGGVFFQIAAGVAPEVAAGTLAAVPVADASLADARLALVARSGRSLPVAAARLAEALAGTLPALG